MCSQFDWYVWQSITHVFILRFFENWRCWIIIIKIWSQMGEGLCNTLLKLFEFLFQHFIERMDYRRGWRNWNSFNENRMKFKRILNIGGSLCCNPIFDIRKLLKRRREKVWQLFDLEFMRQMRRKRRINLMSLNKIPTKDPWNLKASNEEKSLRTLNKDQTLSLFFEVIKRGFDLRI